jgi:hypothetical protein
MLAYTPIPNPKFSCRCAASRARHADAKLAPNCTVGYASAWILTLVFVCDRCGRKFEVEAGTFRLEPCDGKPL